MTELNEGLRRLAELTGDAGGGARMIDALGALGARVRRRRLARTTGVSVAAVGVVAAAGVGAMALADREPPPALPATSIRCGDVADLPTSQAPDLRILVGLSGDLAHPITAVSIAAVGDRAYTAERDDPATLLVMQAGRVVATSDLTGTLTGSFEPYGAGETSGESPLPLATCGAGTPGTLPDGSYTLVGLAAVTAPDGSVVTAVGEPLAARVAGGSVTTAGYVQRTASVQASVGLLARYTCDEAIPATVPGTAPTDPDLVATARLSGTPGPGRDLTVATSLFSRDPAFSGIAPTPVRVQVLADDRPVMAVAGILGTPGAVGEPVTFDVTAPVLWCLSGVDRLPDGDYQTRLIASVPTGAGMVDVLDTGTVTIVGGAVASTVDGPVLRYPARQADAAGNDAEIAGLLALDGECLTLVNDEWGGRWPVVWPAGTTWDAARSAVVSPTGVVMPIGGAVSGAGGYGDVAAVASALGSDAAELAERCAEADGEVAFVNNVDDAIGPAD